MRLSKSFCCVCASVFTACTAFSALSGLNANAYSVSDGYIEISAPLMRSYIGDSISAVYLKDDKTFGNMTLSYFDVQTLAAGDVNSASLPDALVGRSVIWYKGVVPNDQAGVNFFQNPLVVASYNLSFDNVTYIDTGVLQYMGAGDLLALDMSISSLRQYNYLTYSFDSGFSTYYIDSRRSDSSKPGFFRIQQWTQGYYFGLQNIWQSSSPSQFVFGDHSASMLMQDGGSSPGVTLGIICPIVNSDYLFGGNDVIPAPPSGSSGSSSGNASGTIVDNGDGTQDINITVETDNSGLVAALLDGLKGLFIPSESALTAWKDNMAGLLEDHLGGLYQAIGLISGFVSCLMHAEPTDHIHLDQLDLTFSGQSYTLFQAQDIQLKYQQLDKLYTPLALIIDFLCAAAFLRMCRNKLEIILNPDSEVISDDN